MADLSEDANGESSLDAVARYVDETWKQWIGVDKPVNPGYDGYDAYKNVRVIYAPLLAN
jgi:hypothetical protein